MRSFHLSVSNFAFTIIYSMCLVIGVHVTRNYTSRVQSADISIFLNLNRNSKCMSTTIRCARLHRFSVIDISFQWFRHIAHRVYALALWVNDRHINSISAAFSEYIFYSHNVRFVEGLKASENVAHTDAHSSFSNFCVKKKSWSMYFPFQWD